MKILLFVLALTLQAQQPAPTGVISVAVVHAAQSNPAQTITATAGPVFCTLFNPSHTLVRITCSMSGVTYLLQDLTPGFNLTPLTGTFGTGQNLVSWELGCKVVGLVTWSVTANGITRAGQF